MKNIVYILQSTSFGTKGTPYTSFLPYATKYNAARAQRRLQSKHPKDVHGGIMRITREAAIQNGWIKT